MKYKLLIALLLVGITGRAQTLKDTGFCKLVEDSPFGHGWINIPGIIFWLDSKGNPKTIYDSGSIQIIGDTVLAIRHLGKSYDSVCRKYWDLQDYTQGIIDAVAGLRGTGAQIQRYYAAIRRYNEFVYGPAPKKKRRKG